MAFYSEIAPYYDTIFPVGDQQIKFLKEMIGEGVQSIIDIACGNGGHAIRLAKDGYIVTAIDSDEEMIRTAREKADLEGCELALLQAKMDTLKEQITGQFDFAMCIGNSLVHLDTVECVSTFLKSLYSCLHE